MFRFSIRETLFAVALCCLGFGWWIDHQTLAAAKNEATQDALLLASLSMPGFEHCGQTLHEEYHLQKKYGVRIDPAVRDLNSPFD